MFSLPVSLDTAAAFLDAASWMPSKIVSSTISSAPSLSSSASKSLVDVVVFPISSLELL